MIWFAPKSLELLELEPSFNFFQRSLAFGVLISTALELDTRTDKARDGLLISSSVFAKLNLPGVGN
jgi:hypothetical protein